MTTSRARYRAFLQHLQHLPDPHVWSFLVPRVRGLIVEAFPPSSEEWRAKIAQRATKRLNQETRQLHAAVASHPHALLRLLERAYAQRGAAKWDLIRRITLSSPLRPSDWPAWVSQDERIVRYPPATFQPLPPPLRPLTRSSIATTSVSRKRVTPDAAALERREKREARKLWEWQWRWVVPPLTLPPAATATGAGDESGVVTGWENHGVVRSLRRLAAVEHAPTTTPVGRELETFKRLSPSLQAIFPRSPPRRQVDSYPKPIRRTTKSNPQTWRGERELTPRLLQRSYARLWSRLRWTRPLKKQKDKWEECSFEQLAGLTDDKKGKASSSGKRVSPARPQDLKWVEKWGTDWIK